MTEAWAITYLTKDGGREVFTWSARDTAATVQKDFSTWLKIGAKLYGYRVERIRIERVEE